MSGRACAFIAALTFLAAAAPVSAATRIAIGEGTFSVEGDDRVNSLALNWAPGGDSVTITDEFGPVDAPGCTPSGARTVACPYHGEAFSLAGGEGVDRLDLGHPPLELHASISGGEGDDALWGSDYDDLINGGPGIDQLHGRSGDDHLAGGRGSDLFAAGAGDDVVGSARGGDPGRDDYRGGAGDDILNGDDGVADLAFLGGGGDDICALDVKDDPRPESCERIRHKIDRGRG